ncbi:MAG: hypothetical protein ACRCYU_15900 [Nocardioides sp.]
MSIFSECRVVLFVADYAGVDPTGKVNAVGALFNVTQIDAGSGMTPPQHLVVLIEVPPKYVNDTFTLVIDLRDVATGEVVTTATPTGPQALRVSQTVRVELPVLSRGVQVPTDLRARSMSALAFPTGLPLKPGAGYRWRVEIDGQSRPQWYAEFHVLESTPMPRVGGPAQPADPELPSAPSVDEDDVEDPA